MRNTQKISQQSIKPERHICLEYHTKSNIFHDYRCTLMSFVQMKAPAQPPAIPHVCLSFCLGACLGTSQEGLTHPSLDLTSYSTWLLFWRVWRGREGFGLIEDIVGRADGQCVLGGGGWAVGRENVGQHSQSPVTCSSQLESRLQSKPECYVRAYWSVRVHVGKRSASWGWGSIAGRSAAYCHMLSQHGKQTCQSFAGGANWLAQTDPLRVRFGVKMKLKRIWWYSYLS